MRRIREDAWELTAGEFHLHLADALNSRPEIAAAEALHDAKVVAFTFTDGTYFTICRVSYGFIVSDDWHIPRVVLTLDRDSDAEHVASVIVERCAAGCWSYDAVVGLP